MHSPPRWGVSCEENPLPTSAYSFGSVPKEQCTSVPLAERRSQRAAPAGQRAASRARGGCPAGRPTRPTQMVRPSRAEPVLRVFATAFSAGRARSSPRCHGVITPLRCPASADPESAARSESASATPARRHESTAAGLRPEATVTGRPPRQRSRDRAGSGTRQRSGSIRVDPSPAPARAAERRAPAGRGARA